ncbi:MAG TPA: RNA 3'-terminal phosphate cyclase [Pirellulaceae bacterium]|nr:RNA 3'-terminal phosphate cyclase [Pirellulaceae bacterium]HMO91480.1 RNA 3'-terminal phosphate cyclase [Pirellulaceae bacterium]HMP70993.1 RNA 3'-terminal phosphate cyclase [Pirellulaceae bacterium]
MSEPLVIDGSLGEGGGQIVRSSLTLSMLSGRVVEIRNIRAGRKKPGLLNQHLTAVNAARQICNGSVTGAELGSQHLIFAPGRIQARAFEFAIGSAGSTILVAQTLIPALMVADGQSSLEIEGGTHNSAAPPFEYLKYVYLPLLERLGPKFRSEILAWGFYPAGGGRIRIEISPEKNLSGFNLLETGGESEPNVTALVSRLPLTIAERECTFIRHKAGWKAKQCESVRITNSPGPGNVVMIRLAFPNVTEIFTGFGRRGLPAEEVAEFAWQEVCAYLGNQAPVGEHLCDQLLLPLGMAAALGQACQFVTGPLSLHSQTHVELIKKFLPISIEVLPRGRHSVTVKIDRTPPSV